MSEFINIPDYITKREDINKLNNIQKFILLVKGKILSLIINRTSGNFFSSLINLFFFLVSDHLIIASWILFSPKWICPFSIKGSIISILNVFVTAIILGL